MYVPCPGCGTLTRFESPGGDAAVAHVDCPGCHGRFHVAIQLPTGQTELTDYKRALDFARLHGIDVPTAYSVLEGLIKLEEVLGKDEPGPEPFPAGSAEPAMAGASRAAPGSSRVSSPGRSRAAPGTSPTGSSTAPRVGPPHTALRFSSDDAGAIRLGRAPQGQPSGKASSAAGDHRLPYDKGFEPSVRDGCLTVAQAIERGDREALAARIAERHRLPLDLARQAADNRITIRQAIAQRLTRRKVPDRTEVVRRPRAKMVAMIFAGLLILLVGMQIEALWRRTPPASDASGGSGFGATGTNTEPGDPASADPAGPRRRAAATVDASGQVLKIVGPNPRSVLVAFCTNGVHEGMQEPMDVVDTTPPTGGWRLGIFRSTVKADAPLLAIRIRREEGSSEWTAGDGRRPIPTEELRARPAPGEGTPSTGAEPAGRTPGGTAQGAAASGESATTSSNTG